MACSPGLPELCCDDVFIPNSRVSVRHLQYGVSHGSLCSPDFSEFCRPRRYLRDTRTIIKESTRRVETFTRNRWNGSPDPVVVYTPDEASWQSASLGSFVSGVCTATFWQQNYTTGSERYEIDMELTYEEMLSYTMATIENIPFSGNTEHYEFDQNGVPVLTTAPEHLQFLGSGVHYIFNLNGSEEQSYYELVIIKSHGNFVPPSPYCLAKRTRNQSCTDPTGVWGPYECITPFGAPVSAVTILPDLPVASWQSIEKRLWIPGESGAPPCCGA